MKTAEFNRRAVGFLPTLIDRARKVCGNEPDALDLSQDTVVKGLQNLHQLQDVNKTEGWLATIQANTFRQGRRRRDFQLALPLDTISGEVRDTDDPEDALAAPNPLDRYARILHRATPKRRAAVVAFLQAKGVQKEMSRLLQISESAARRKVQDFREWLERNGRDFPRDDEQPLGWMRPHLDDAIAKAASLAPGKVFGPDYSLADQEQHERRRAQEEVLYSTVASRLNVKWWSVAMYVQSSIVLPLLFRELSPGETPKQFDFAVKIPKEKEVDGEGGFNTWSYDVAAAADSSGSMQHDQRHPRPSREHLRTNSLGWAWAALGWIPKNDPLTELVINSNGPATLRRVIQQILDGHADERSLTPILWYGK